MRVLIDIGHPGHVHLFKNLARLLIADGAEVLFTARQKEFETELLKSEGFSYVSFGKHYRKFSGKIWGLLKFDIRMFLEGLKFKPDLFLSHGSIYAAHAAFLLGKRHLSLEDSGNMEQIVLYRPFTDAILTPDVLPEELGPRQIRYRGYHEIAYLHPEFFHPDPAVYDWLGLGQGEPYAIIRLVSWNATHDVGHKGLSNEDKIELVRHILDKDIRVFITSEAGLPPELQPFLIRIAPEKLHHALYYASLVVSEGATIASESGVVGTPAIYINTITRSYCQDQEKYGLVFNTSEADKVRALVDRILQTERQEYRRRREKLINEKINVTRFLYDFVMERYLKNGVPSTVGQT